MLTSLTENTQQLMIGFLVGIALMATLFAVYQQYVRRQALKQQNALFIAQSRDELSQTQLAELKQQQTNLQRERVQLQRQLSEMQSKAAHFQALATPMKSLEASLAKKEDELTSLRQILNQRETQLADIQARADSDAQHHQAQLALLNDSKEHLKKEFSHLANEIFEQKQRSFSEQSQASMVAMLEPFNQQIQQFRQRVDDIHTQDTRGRSQLLAQLDMLKNMNSQLNKQADDLTKALKGDKKVQGSWGELQVERILESSGLQKGREFEREQNFKDDSGNNFRPDFTIHLPDGKHIIIDSKVSLNAYQMAVSSDTEAERASAMKEHISAIRQHIRSLSQKNYPKLEGMNAPDFVLMFMPIESAFVMAFEADSNLFNDAFEQHIVVVTPTTLLATLRTVANIWVLERQNENAKELFKLAGKIFDKFVIFSEKMERLGMQLTTADKTYHEAMSSLSEGRGSMVSYVHRLKEVGAPSNKKIPDSMTTSEILSEATEMDS